MTFGIPTLRVSRLGQFCSQIHLYGYQFQSRRSTLYLLLVLEKYKSNGGPSENEFREQYDRGGTFKDVKLQSNKTCQFQKRFITAVIDNLRA